MNKILKNVLCGVALVPVAFCFSACGGSNKSVNAKSYNELLNKSALSTLTQNYAKHTNKVITQSLTSTKQEKILYEYKTSATATDTVKNYHINTLTATRSSTIQMVGQGELSAFRVVKAESMVSTSYEVVDQLLVPTNVNREIVEEWHVASRDTGTATEYVVVYTKIKKIDGDVVPEQTVKNYEIITNHEKVVEDYLVAINEYLAQTFYVSPEMGLPIGMGEEFNTVEYEKDGKTITAVGQSFAFSCFDYKTSVKEVGLEVKFKENLPTSYKANIKVAENELTQDKNSVVDDMRLDITVSEKTVSITLPSLDGYVETTVIIESPISDMGM